MKPNIDPSTFYCWFEAVDEQNAQTLELEMMRDNRHIEGSSLREASRSAPSFAALAVESEVQPEKPVPLLQPPGT